MKVSEQWPASCNVSFRSSPGKLFFETGSASRVLRLKVCTATITTTLGPEAFILCVFYCLGLVSVSQQLLTVVYEPECQLTLLLKKCYFN